MICCPISDFVTTIFGAISVPGNTKKTGKHHQGVQAHIICLHRILNEIRSFFSVFVTTLDWLSYNWLSYKWVFCKKIIFNVISPGQLYPREFPHGQPPLTILNGENFPSYRYQPLPFLTVPSWKVLGLSLRRAVIVRRKIGIARMGNDKGGVFRVRVDRWKLSGGGVVSGILSGTPVRTMSRIYSLYLENASQRVWLDVSAWMWTVLNIWYVLFLQVQRKTTKCCMPIKSVWIFKGKSA